MCHGMGRRNEMLGAQGMEVSLRFSSSRLIVIENSVNV